MRVIRQARELLPAERNVCLAIGMFDGVHLGHRQVLLQTVSDAQLSRGLPVAITFDQHPNAIVAPERTPLLIYSVPQRLRAIDALGIEAVLLIHFDREFSQQSGKEFILRLARDLGRVGSVCIGRDFSFGHKRSGNVTTLKALGRDLGFTVHDVAPVSLRGKTLSSTRIREAIQAGDLARASEMLGRPYAVAGTVIAGRHLGHSLGFPTANLDTTGLAIPPPGVYAGRALVGGVAQPAVTNVGYRPTLNLAEPELRVEVHLLEFRGDLYGQELEFVFGQKLRGEQKFASLEALREQIQKDVRQARSVLSV